MKQPKIRLKGFQGDWVKTPFSEMVNRVSASASSLNYPGVEFEDINSGEGTLNKDVSRKKTVKIGKQFTEGDILFGKLRPYLKNILLADFNGVAIGDFWVLRPQKVTSELLYILVNSREFMRVANISSGSKMPRADWNLVSSTSFAYPNSKGEQNAIGAYFQHIDSLIQSTAKKIESLKQVKAASLQSMFPQEGETTPRVRFKGFEGEWEKVLASNVFKTFNEKNRPDLPVLSATQDKGMVARDSIGYNISHDKSNEATYKHILPGQFVIHLRSFQGGFAHSCIEGIASPAYTIMEFKDKERHFDLYWKYIFMSKEFIKRLELITYGIRDGRSISFDEFCNMNFVVPSYKEQHKIADFFSNLDSQITLQTQRLEKLKQIKSACLDNMFV